MFRLYGNYRQPGDTALQHQKDRHEILANDEFHDIWQKRKAQHLRSIRATIAPHIGDAIATTANIVIPQNLKRKGTENALLRFIAWWQMKPGRRGSLRPSLSQTIIDRIVDVFQKRKAREKEIQKLRRDRF